MKKKLFILALLTVLAAGTAFASHPGGWGVGVLGRYGGGWGTGARPGAALSLKVPSLPIYWGIDFDMWEEGVALGVTGDYYLIDSLLVSDLKLHWFLGLGGYVNLGLYEKGHLDLGARLPIGLSWQPINLLEIFLDVAPSIGIQIIPTTHLGGGWRTELGIRLWF